VSHHDFVVISVRTVPMNPAPGTDTWARNQSQAKYWYSRSSSAQQASATSRSSSSVGAGSPATTVRPSARCVGVGKPRNAN